MYIVVGLGNPGKKYENTRHNVGFITIDRLAEKLDIRVDKLKWKSLYGQGFLGGEKILLAKPQTFMNLSGEAVKSMVDFFNLDLDKLIVIVDDVDIEFGSVRVKARGSAGTHNGLKSIIRLLGDDKFPRVKISVGQSPDYMDLADFVLSGFSKKEAEIVEKEIDLARDAVISIIEDGVDRAMNETNAKKLI